VEKVNAVSSPTATPEKIAAPANAARQFPRMLLVILAVGAVLRIALILACGNGQGTSIIDERDYNLLATNLVQHGEFAIHQGQICSSRPPVYPAVLAVVYSVAGIENFQAVRFVQAGLGLVLVWQVYLFGSRLFDRRTALVAAAITSFYPELIGFTVLLLSEVLFSVFLLAALLALQKYWSKRSLLKLAEAGLWFGVATLTRSVLWPFVPMFGLYVFATDKSSFLRRTLAATIAVVAFIAPIAPWTYRNMQLEHAFIAVDVLGGRNLMMGNYEHTLEYRAWDTITVHGPESWDQTLAVETPNYRELTQGQRDKLAMGRGLRYIADHPLVFLRRSTIKFFNFWQLPRTLIAGMADGRWGPFSRPTIWNIAGVLFTSYAACLLAGVCGFLLLLPEDRRMHWFLLLIVAFVCGVHTVVFAHARYHLALMPLVFVYSAHGMLHWRELWAARGSKAAWLAVTICTLLVGSWFWQALWVEGERIRNWMQAAV
jgi:4-amino-4-deoxy-L-arabinose transferase-like glycosyltransferase